MRLSKLSIILFAALCIGTVSAGTGTAGTSTAGTSTTGTQTEIETEEVGTQTPPLALQRGAIGIAENVDYAEESYLLPRKGVIVGRNSIGMGQLDEDHPHGSVIVGNNSVIGGGYHPVLIGSNSVDMSTNGILIGSDSHIGATLRWKGKDGKIYTPESGNYGNAPSNTIVLGNNASIHEQSEVLSLGNKNTIAGSATVALGHGSYVGNYSTAVGSSSFAIAQHSIALGMGSCADRSSHYFGYNPATGQAYTFDDYSDELDEQSIRKLNQLNNKRIALENSLEDLKNEYLTADYAFKESYEKMASTIFENPEKKDEFLAEHSRLEAEQTEALNNYVQADEYDELNLVKDELAEEANHAALPIMASAGAASIGWDGVYTRQLTNLAAGSTDTDAVNVMQLKDLRNYTNNRINAVEQGLAAQNSRLNKMDKKFERGLAANAALAGLMQPYNVKKFNITVGLGGYRSATAIAAGAGYRFSNNAAVKAGIATNTANFDDLSYNVSTAFEF